MEMGRGGGEGSVPHGGREKGERERGPQARQLVAWGEGCGRQRCCANRGEQWGAGDVTLRDRHAGLGGVRARWQRLAYARERREGQRGDGALIGGPGPHSVRARFKLSFKPVQKYSNSSNEI
jgi:hypothetical protein